MSTLVFDTGDQDRKFRVKYRVPGVKFPVYANIGQALSYDREGNLTQPVPSLKDLLESWATRGDEDIGKLELQTFLENITATPLSWLYGAGEAVGNTVSAIPGAVATAFTPITADKLKEEEEDFQGTQGSNLIYQPVETEEDQDKAPQDNLLNRLREQYTIPGVLEAEDPSFLPYAGLDPDSVQEMWDYIDAAKAMKSELLPEVGDREAPPLTDPAVFEAYLNQLAELEPEGIDQGRLDKMRWTNVLGALASGASGGMTLADVLSGAGGAGGQAVAQMGQYEEQLNQKYQERMSAYNKLMAEAGLGIADRQRSEELAKINFENKLKDQEWNRAAENIDIQNRDLARLSTLEAQSAQLAQRLAENLQATTNENISVQNQAALAKTQQMQSLFNQLALEQERGKQDRATWMGRLGGQDQGFEASIDIAKKIGGPRGSDMQQELLYRQAVQQKNPDGAIAVIIDDVLMNPTLFTALMGEDFDKIYQPIQEAAGKLYGFQSKEAMEHAATELRRAVFNAIYANQQGALKKLANAGLPRAIDFLDQQIWSPQPVKKIEEPTAKSGTEQLDELTGGKLQLW